MIGEACLFLMGVGDWPCACAGEDFVLGCFDGMLAELSNICSVSVLLLLFNFEIYETIKNMYHNKFVHYC